MLIAIEVIDRYQKFNRILLLTWHL